MTEVKVGHQWTYMNRHTPEQRPCDGIVRRGAAKRKYFFQILLSAGKTGRFAISGAAQKTHSKPLAAARLGANRESN